MIYSSGSKEKLKANFFNELTGCDLLLVSAQSEEADLTSLPKKTPILLNQGDKYFIGRSQGRQWIFTELDTKVINQAQLEFPAAGDAPVLLSYHRKFQRLINHIKDKDSQININKKPSDSNILEELAIDSRFDSEYPCLKYVLTRIFSLTDADDKAAALHQLENSNLIDWTTPEWSSEYKKLDTHYGYFDGLDTEKTLILNDLFKTLAIKCRTMIVLFEKNNNIQDTLAYDYAYKLMALLVDHNDLTTPNKLFDKISQETYKLLRPLDNKTGKPFHDALLVLLHLPYARDIADRNGWMKFIKQEGIQAFRFLAMAKKIEHKIAEREPLIEQEDPYLLRAPKTLTEAHNISKHLLYRRANDDIEFANVCYAHHVKEETFNRCLDYIASGWPKKYEDSLPNVIITGEEGARNFVWVKLPTNDKRALILGYITICCQSIDGNSAMCVKDAMNLSDNGLYVLLLQRSGQHPDPIVNQQINYANFDIVGQSYAWKSTTGNLCLDSIECLSSVPKSIIKNILTDFATQVLQDYPDIKRINVGRGGKTPSGLFDISAISEKMKQGKPYSDSDTQYCIGRTTNRFNELQIVDILELLVNYSIKLKDIILYLGDYIADKDTFIKRLKCLMQTTPERVHEFTPEAIELLLTLNKNPTVDDFEPVDFDALDRMNAEQEATYLASVSTARLLWRMANDPSHLIRALPYIPKDELFSVVETMRLYLPNSPLRSWLTTQRNILYPAVKNRLHEMIHSAADCQYMMSILSTEQRAFVCRRISTSLAEQVPDIIHSADDYRMVTMFFDNSAKELVYAAIKHKIHDWIRSEGSFVDILKSFSSDSGKTEFCLDVADKIPAEITPQKRVFEAMMLYLPKEQRLTFYQLHKNKFLNNIQSISDFTDSISPFSKEQHAEIYEQIKDKLISMVQSADDFFSVRHALETKQRKDFYEALKDNVPAMLKQKMELEEFTISRGHRDQVSKSSKLILFTKQFSISELIELLPSIRTMINDVFTSFSVYQEVFSDLNRVDPQKSQLIYETIQDKLISNITSVKDYNYALKILPLEQCLLIYESLKETMPDILPPAAITNIASVNDFSSALAKLSPKRQAELYDTWSNKLHGFIKSLYSVISIRRLLPIEQRLALYQSINLSSLITNVPDYCELIDSRNGISRLEPIPSSERVVIYEVMRTYLPRLVKSSDDFRDLMEALHLDQKQEEFYDIMKEQLPELINSPRDFFIVMQPLTQEQRTYLYQRIKDKLNDMIIDLKNFQSVASYLTDEQRTALFLEHQSMFLDKISTLDDFYILRELLPENYHQSLWNAKLINNISAHINPSVPGIDSKPLARALVTNFHETKNQLDALFQSMDRNNSSSVYGIFEKRSPIARFINALASLESMWIAKINVALELHLSSEQLDNFSDVTAALENYYSAQDRNDFYHYNSNI